MGGKARYWIGLLTNNIWTLKGKKHKNKNKNKNNSQLPSRIKKANV